MDLEKIKKYWHPLTLPMGLFTAWLWSFPMYGPLLAAGGDRINSLFLFFLISHALGLLLYGFLIDYFYKKGNINYNFEVKLYIFFSVLVGILTMFFPFLPVSLFVPGIVVIGLFSGPLVVFYLYYLGRSGRDNYRGRILAFIFFLAGIVSLIFLLIPAANWMFVLTGLFLFLPLLLPKIPVKIRSGSINREFPETGFLYWAVLILLIIMFYIGGGLMYSLSYSNIISSGEASFDAGFLFYMVTALPAGILADRKGRRYLINIGLCFSGLGFLLMLLFSADLINSLSLGFLQSGFAVMDIFVFLTLIDWNDHFRNRKFVGTGFFLNVMIILVSSLPFLGRNAGSLIPDEYIPAAGLVLILFIIPFLNLLKETSPLQQRLNFLINKQFDLEDLYKKYSLTSREREVADLLLDGKGTSEITEDLYISYNTLKTHLKNIYRKTNCGGQTDFILLVWKETEK